MTFPVAVTPWDKVKQEVDRMVQAERSASSRPDPNVHVAGPGWETIRVLVERMDYISNRLQLGIIDSLTAIEQKIGVDDSQDPDSIDYRLRQVEGLIRP